VKSILERGANFLIHNRIEVLILQTYFATLDQMEEKNHKNFAFLDQAVQYEVNALPWVEGNGNIIVLHTCSKSYSFEFFKIIIDD